MISDPPKTDPASSRWSRWLPSRRTIIATVLVLVVAVEPALAQESAVCEAERLPEMISGFFQLTTAVGLMGLVVVWQADSLVEMFTVRPDQREALKRHKRTALKSAVVLLVLGPLTTVAGSMMNLPIAQCVDLTPW
ncbi:hypothetical protein [Haloparvum sedimenti]|uniref:hypothetical protein n=1 Tax=Haloparvum sedimenti TaxID=1678448 RepID=UPI0009B59D22|nr:hypothetical protein [Haloparvum sedimenti]